MRRALWLVVAVVVALGLSPTSDVGRERAGDPGGNEDSAGLLRLGLTPLGSLDPAQARSLEQLLVADQLFDSLTALDPVTSEPGPSLAARWEATPDQRQWTFFLRRGASFANGREVTAADVKYSLERVARRGGGSSGAELLQGVSGYLEFRNGAPELAGVTVPAVDTVQVTLSEPLAEFPSVMASPVLGVVPREAVEAAQPATAFAKAPVGSGPFRFVGRAGAVVSLARADVGSGDAQSGDADRADTAGRVHRLRVVQYETVSEAYRAFTRGQVDWSRVPPDEVEEAGRRYGERAFRPYVAQLFYGFRLSDPKLGDARFREAMARGIDRRALVSAVYHGTARVGEGIVAAGVPGHQRRPCPRCAHDQRRARALLAEAFPPGTTVPEVNLDYDADPSQDAIAKAIQSNLAEVGIKVMLRAHAVDAYDDLVLSGAPEVFRLGWVASYPSPEAFLTPLFRSGSANNLTGFAGVEVDTLLSAARAEPERRRRLALYQEAERAILDQVPVIPIAQFEVHAVVSQRVRNLVTTTMGTFGATTVTLAGRP